MTTNEEKYPSLYYVSPKLTKSEELSDHNKQVLEDFFDIWRDRVANKSTCEGYANKWLNFAPYIDFKIDEASREEMQELYKKLERGKISKQNDEEYSPVSKEKHHKAMSTFYRNFIDYPNSGYKNNDTNGPSVVNGLDKRLDTKTKDDKVKKETKPDPSQIKEIASNTTKFRDKCLIVFGWAVGARSGEVFPTPDKPEALKWKDIKFNDDDSMTVHLRLNNKKKVPNRRRVNVIASKPLMEELYKRENPDLDDPVFKKDNPKLQCHKCGSTVQRVEGEKGKKSYNRKYRCDDCNKIIKRNKLMEEYAPLKRRRVNDIIGKAVADSGYRKLDKTSHPFFRKARALQKVAMNWNDSSINGFFGWEIGSQAKKRYYDALQVNQKKDLKQEHPELDINVEGRFHDDSLDPVKCSSCGKLNSRLWDFCRSCNHELTYQGVIMKGSGDSSVKETVRNETKDEMIEYLKKKADISESEFEETLIERLDDKIEEQIGEEA